MLRRERDGVDGGHHVGEPPVALGGGDGIRLVAHPQPRVTSLVAVGGGAAPVLLKKEAQPGGRGGEIGLGIKRPQLGVVGDPAVELRDESLKGRVAVAMRGQWAAAR